MSKRQTLKNIATDEGVVASLTNLALAAVIASVKELGRGR